MPFREFLPVLCGIFVLLLVATITGWLLSRKYREGKAAETVANMRSRTNAWWVMAVVFTGMLAAGRTTIVVFYALLSFLALREFITLQPTRRGDHRALFWAFFVILPAHYLFIGIGWFMMFLIWIPVYAFVFLPVRTVLSGDCERFLERTSKVQWGLLVCVYFVSYLPMLLYLQIPGYESRTPLLLLWFVLVVQLSDVFQYVWGKLFGRRKIARHVSPSKTVEGFVLGVSTAAVIGMATWSITPFSPLAALAFALMLGLMGFLGGLIMSAIKRDTGIKDWGHSIPGHGGILDRMDSLCFAAPVFFHLCSFFYSRNMALTWPKPEWVTELVKWMGLPAAR